MFGDFFHCALFLIHSDDHFNIQFCLCFCLDNFNAMLSQQAVDSTFATAESIREFSGKHARLNVGEPAATSRGLRLNDAG